MNYTSVYAIIIAMSENMNNELMEAYVRKIVAEMTQSVLNSINIQEIVSDVRNELMVQLLAVLDMINSINNRIVSLEEDSQEMKKLIQKIEDINNIAKKIDDEIALEVGLLSTVSEETSTQISLLEKMYNSSSNDVNTIISKLQSDLSSLLDTQRTMKKEINDYRITTHRLERRVNLMYAGFIASAVMWAGLLLFLIHNTFQR
ncbi:MAG TPA: hypothetical protein ENO30_04310 [Thermodesulfobium narugense]|nr:hypothetical protein [Thermodesulfobium narugense]